VCKKLKSVDIFLYGVDINEINVDNLVNILGHDPAAKDKENDICHLILMTFLTKIDLLLIIK
jgi:hypothetical protein